jgi:queuosine precursor transporter
LLTIFLVSRFFSGDNGLILIIDIAVRRRLTGFLVIAHMVIICVSNILVQIPISVFGLRTTWGAFSYPLIFVLTDLATRLLNAKIARKVVYMAMLPGLISSFFISNWFEYGYFFACNVMVMRIALASFSAYILGQLIDILFFVKLRQQKKWWVAPTVASIFGNFLDTYCFFFIAFYQGRNAYVSAHWMEIATVDLAFKLIISLVSFIPVYGLVLSWASRRQFNMAAMATQPLPACKPIAVDTGSINAGA